MVFIVDEAATGKELSMEEVSRLLKGFFSLLKTFLDSLQRSSCCCCTKTSETEGTGRLLAEGLLGMFLSAAQEFGSVQFRTVRTQYKSELRDAIPRVAGSKSKSYRDHLPGRNVCFPQGVSVPRFFRNQRS